jgi:putative transposase
VLAWRLSNTMDVSFCVAVLEDALGAVRPAEIFRSGQPVHHYGLHRSARRGRHPHLFGRSRVLDGQRVHRTAVAVAQVRG